MWRYIKEYRFYITLFFFILVPIVSIDTATRAPRDYRVHDRVIVALTSPLQTALSFTVEWVVEVVQNYVFLWNVQKDNAAVLEENRKLLTTIIDLREMEEENHRLRQLLDFKEQFKFKAVVARVISKDVSTEFRAIRINRGESSGIRKDMAVVNSEGIVGRVLRTTRDTADIVTMLDLLSAVDSIVKRSRARGIVEGMTDEICQLKFALRTDDIQPGDLLISSGLGGIFPKGVPVGTVADVHRLPFGITQTVKVRPAVDFSKLEEVLILTESGTSPVHITTQTDRFPKRTLSKAAPEGT